MFIGKEEFLVPPQPKANFLGAGMESETGAEADRPKSGMSKSKISKEHNSMTDENGPEKTPEERAREIAASLCRGERCTGCVTDRHPDECNWCPGVEIFRTVFPALRQAEHRAYQRGYEDAAKAGQAPMSRLTTTGLSYVKIEKSRI